MTEEQAIKKMNKILHEDVEAAHGDADDILTEFLKSKGYKRLVEAYDKIPKWYV